MTLEEIKTEFPVFGSKIPKNVFTDRELVLVDDNYVEEDGEETEEFDSSIYNYILYIPLATLEIIGEKGLARLGEMLENFEKFTSFVASEEDLFGVYSDLSEEEIAKVLFAMLEEIVS